MNVSRSAASVALILGIFCGVSFADEKPQPAPSEGEEAPAESATDSKSDLLAQLKDTVTPYGSLRVRYVLADGESEIQNGSSRLGVRLRREVTPKFAVIGRLEFQINLVENPTVLTPGDNTGSELVSVENAETFATRLGWLGFDFGKAGRLSFGKQWSAYYDVAGWTDQFYVFGASSLGVFTAGTDGGEIGTGRAEQAVIWRVDTGRLTFGVQFQAKGLSSQDSESGGASVRFRATDWLQLGVAYNEARLGNPDEVMQVITFTDDPRTIAAGLHIDHGRLTAALVYADQRQSEVGQVGDDLTLFDSTGLELYARYGFDDRFGLFGGGNWRDADDEGLGQDGDIEHYYLGGDWHFHKQSFAYVQGRLASKSGRDAIVLGLRYNF